MYDLLDIFIILTVKFYIQMEYDGKNMYEFFRFFMNFISSCALYMPDEPICAGYVSYL
jgi:hypothetical protein